MFLTFFEFAGMQNTKYLIYDESALELDVAQTKN